MNGVQFCARFSLATNRLHYCGPSEVDRLLYRTIVDGTDVEASRAALMQFEALGPYLRAIGAKHGREPLDYEVAEAYWIGNDLLEGFTRDEFGAILEAFSRRGLPRPTIDRLATGLPENPHPYHVFHVTYVGVGSVSGKVPTTVETMDLCRPSWGRVLEIRGNHILVEKPTLLRDESGLALGPAQTESYEFDSRVLPNLAVGDSVAFHWGWPAVRLTPTQLDRLRDYTKRSLNAANASLRALGLDHVERRAANDEPPAVPDREV